MANDTELNPGTGGDKIHTKDRGAYKTHVVLIDAQDGSGAEALVDGSFPAEGAEAHDAPVTKKPVLVAGRASAAAPTAVSADGDVVQLWLDRNGRVQAVVTNGGTFAVQDSQKVADNAVFTDGTTPVDPAGFVFDEVAGTALTENDAAAARIDAKRAQVIAIEDATTRGQRLSISAGGAAKVDGSAVTQPVAGTETTVSVDIQRPNDTNTYTQDDAWAKTTPDAGGTTFAGCARTTGKGGVILSAVIVSSANPTLKLVGKLYLFDSSVTAIADADPFTVTDAEAKTAVAEIDFTLNSFGPSGAGNSVYFATSLNRKFTTVGSADLRGLVRVMNAYIPAANEVLTIRLQIEQTS